MTACKALRTMPGIGSLNILAGDILVCLAESCFMPDTPANFPFRIPDHQQKCPGLEENYMATLSWPLLFKLLSLLLLLLLFTILRLQEANMLTQNSSVTQYHP